MCAVVPSTKLCLAVPHASSVYFVLVRKEFICSVFSLWNSFFSKKASEKWSAYISFQNDASIHLNKLSSRKSLCDVNGQAAYKVSFVI